MEYGTPFTQGKVEFPGGIRRLKASSASFSAVGRAAGGDGYPSDFKGGNGKSPVYGGFSPKKLLSTNEG